MTARALTQRQEQVLSHIRQSIGERGCPPTLRELCERLGLHSTNAVGDHLRALERKGRIARTLGSGVKVSRGIRLLDDGAPAVAPANVSPASGANSLLPEIPVYREIGAERIATIRRPSFAGEAGFVLVMRGEAMTGRGIFPGDYLFVENRQPKAGEVALVRLGDETTARTIGPGLHAGQYVAFEAANPGFSTVLLRANELSRAVLGRVVCAYHPVPEGSR